MTVYTITPDTVLPASHVNEAMAPSNRDAHRYCRECGYNSYLMVVEPKRERAVFITNPFDLPEMGELTYRGAEHGGWGAR